MTAGLDPIGFGDHFPNAVTSDGNTSFLTADLFDPGLPTFDDPALFQGAFLLAQPPPPFTFEDFPIFFEGVPPDTSPQQTLEHNAFISLPATLEVSLIPRTATVPAIHFTRDCDPRYQRTTGAELVVTGDTNPPLVVPTIPLPPQSPPSTFTFPNSWLEIPQRSYNYGRKQFDFRPLEPIFFSTEDHPGINLADALHKNSTRLNGKDDPMIQATSGTTSCRLLFPGYPDNGSSCQIHMLNWIKTRTPISRAKLAHEVAKKVDRYLTHMTRIAPDESIEGCWRIGQGFMHIDNVYLVRLVWVSKGSFQPVLYVKVPSAPRARADGGRG